MNIILKGASVYTEGVFVRRDIAVSGGRIVSADNLSGLSAPEIIDCKNKYIFPGFVDVHVHLREPGFSYKETVKSGTRAAAHGGFTTVFAMPNLCPAPDSVLNLAPQLEIIKRDAAVRVLPYGTLTKGELGAELSDMDALAPYVCAFSDDGRGVQNDTVMREAMLKAKELGKIICAHCEDNSLLRGGYIHDGAYAKAHGHRGICSESEWKQAERDIRLAAETGCAYHVCHVSSKESVSLIRAAKTRGVNITCETAPHYLVLCEDDIKEDGRFKMNPPLRTREDKEALITGILDGTIDMIATDHAPHSAEEKSRGLEKSLFGITGLETAFPVLYTKLVKTGIIPLGKLVGLLSVNPALRFGLESGIKKGAEANLSVFDLDTRFTINPETFESMGKSTPFENTEVYGENILTIYGGKIVWRKK